MPPEDQRYWSPLALHTERAMGAGREYLEWLKGNNSSRWSVQHVRKLLCDEMPRPWLSKRIQALPVFQPVVHGELKNGDKAFVSVFESFWTESRIKEETHLNPRTQWPAWCDVVYVTLAAIRVRRTWLRAVASKRGFNR